MSVFRICAAVQPGKDSEIRRVIDSNERSFVAVIARLLVGFVRESCEQLA